MSSEKAPSLRLEPGLMPDETFMRQSLSLLAGELKTRRHLGYPGLGDRFRGIKSILLEAGRMELGVEDPWNVGQTIPTEEELGAIAEMGCRTDSLGRPKHPWYQKMAGDVAVGVVMGKGFYREWGPNYTADSVVIQNDHVLLIERSDSGLLAVAGGFIDTDTETGLTEEPVHAAIREPWEEAGIDLSDCAQPKQIYQGPVADIRMTANAWPETTAFLFDLGNDSALPPVRGADDAKSASWYPLETARQARLHGSHKLLIELALQAL